VREQDPRKQGLKRIDELSPTIRGVKCESKIQENKD